jgi:hypothetical protein
VQFNKTLSGPFFVLYFTGGSLSLEYAVALAIHQSLSSRTGPESPCVGATRGWSLRYRFRDANVGGSMIQILKFIREKMNMCII